MPSLCCEARQVSPGGRIIAFSTSVIAKALPPFDPHIALKAGVEGLVQTEAQIARMSKLPPLEGPGQPEDIANVVSFLTGPVGGWVNGQVVCANGGFA